MKNKTLLYICLFFFVLVCFFYFEVLFLGKSLCAYLYHPLEQYGIFGCQHNEIANNFNIDLASPAFELAPINHLVGTIYRSFNLPLWNPYQGCGTPLAAQYSSRVFFPYQIIENISPWWMWDFFILGRILIAGIFTFLFLKKISAHTFISVLGAVFYMFSGSMVWFINNEQFVNVAITVPMIFLALENFIQCRSKRALAWFSLSVALVLLAGQPEIAVYVLFVAFMYCLFRIYKDKLSSFEINFAVFLAFILGVAAAAIQIVPFHELMLNSFNCHPPGSLTGLRSPTPLGFFIVLLLPLFPGKTTFYRFLPHNGIWDYLGGFTGLLMVYLLILGLFLKKNKYYGFLIFFSTCAGVILLKNFNCPLFSWIGTLPLLEQSWSPRWAGSVWNFSFAVAAALSLEAIRKDITNHKLKFIIPAGFIFISCISFYVFFNYFFQTEDFHVVLGISNFSEVSVIFLRELFLAAVFLSIVLYLVIGFRKTKYFPYAIIILALAELIRYIPKGIDNFWQNIMIVPFFIACFAAIMVVKGFKRSAAIIVMVSMLSFISVWVLSTKGLPNKYDIASGGKGFDFLTVRQGYFRTVGKKLLPPNFASIFGIYDLRYIDALSPVEYQHYVNNYLLKQVYDSDTDRLWFINVDQDSHVKNSFSFDEILAGRNIYYSFLGTKYILVPKDVELDYPLIYSNDIKIYENPYVMPRAFIVHDIEHANSYKHAQAMMGSLQFNPRITAIVEDKRISLDKNVQKFENNSLVEIKKYSYNKIIIKTDSLAQGLLVLTDIFYPGWRVYVDGKLSTIYRVNGLVRGVLLEKGQHDIVFTYFPFTVKIGIVVTGFSIFLLLCLIFSKNQSLVNKL